MGISAPDTHSIWRSFVINVLKRLLIWVSQD
jgi:hypothetical protein